MLYDDWDKPVYGSPGVKYSRPGAYTLERMMTTSLAQHNARDQANGEPVSLAIAYTAWYNATGSKSGGCFFLHSSARATGWLGGTHEPRNFAEVPMPSIPLNQHVHPGQNFIPKRIFWVSLERFQQSIWFSVFSSPCALHAHANCYERIMYEKEFP